MVSPVTWTADDNESAVDKVSVGLVVGSRVGSSIEPYVGSVVGSVDCGN